MESFGNFADLQGDVSALFERLQINGADRDAAKVKFTTYEKEKVVLRVKVVEEEMHRSRSEFRDFFKDANKFPTANFIEKQ